MTSAGAVSYPVTKAAGLTSFNPGPLTRGPDGNIWFADPLAGIDIAGTIGTVDIATNVASEYSTPLMKTTIQISRRTSQDQKCDTGDGGVHADRHRNLRPRSGPCRGARHPGVGPDPGGAADPGLSRHHLPHRDHRADARPGLHGDRADAGQRLHDDDLPDHHRRPEQRHRLHASRTRSRRTASSASSAPASRRDRRPTRSPPAPTATSGSPSTTAPGSASSTSRPSSPPSTGRCRRRRRRSRAARTATSGSPSAAATARPR